MNGMFMKEEEVRGKIWKLRDGIMVFGEVIKVEVGKNEEGRKLLVDGVKEMREENDVLWKGLEEKVEVLKN